MTEVETEIEDKLPEDNVDDIKDEMLEKQLERSRPPIPPKPDLVMQNNANGKVPMLNFANIKHIKEYTLQPTTTISQDQFNQAPP